MLSIHAASATDSGRVRSTNQDRFLVTERLIAVADGMGGHAGGEVAAQVAVEGLAFSFDPTRDRHGLVDAARAANGAVYERATQDQALRGMGTTLTAAALVHRRGRDELQIVNVGDSRAYLLGADGLVRVTEDHSLVEQMVRHGEISAEQALVHPHRHILTRAIGIDADLDVDSFLIDAAPGLRVLLCSDGLTNELVEEEIAEVLRSAPDRQAAADELVRRAIAHGGNDNVTVVVADVEDDEDPGASVAEAAVGTQALSSKVLHPRSAPTGASAPRARHRQAATRSPQPSFERLFTVRVAAFVVLLLATLGGIAGFTVWFNRGTYYVGIDHGNVAIFQGRPGGFLWFQPNVVLRTSFPVSSVLDANVALLKAGMLESSFADAERVVANLENERSLLGLPLPTTSTTAGATLPAASGTSGSVPTTARHG